MIVKCDFILRGSCFCEKYCQVVYKDALFADKLLTAPLNDGGVLPSPVMLMNKIIIKDKKRMKDDLESSYC